MRRAVIGLSMALTFGVAHAETGDSRLFDCMDSKSFEVNSSCMADKISNNVKFRDAQNQVFEFADNNSSDYVIATMTFDQRNMQIDIVAHRDSMIAMNKISEKSLGK